MSWFYENNGSDQGRESLRWMRSICAGQSHTFNSKIHSNSALEELYSMKKENILCDVTLAVEGVKINAHRAVLSSCSQYFRTMFTTNFKEKSEEEIRINDIDSHILEQLIDFIYTSKIIITEENVEALFMAASLFHVAEVKDACCEFFEKQLHSSNCVGIRVFADFHDCKNLFSKADSYVVEHFSEVIKETEYLKLSVHDILRLIQDDKLAVSGEEEVFDCVMNWIKHDIESRRCHLSTLWQHIRIPLMGQDFLIKLMKDRLLLEHSECAKDVMKSLSYRLMNKNYTMGLDSIRTKPRQSTDTKMLLVLNKDSKPGMLCYNFKWRTWITLNDQPPFQPDSGIVMSGELVYVLGGSSSYNVTVYNMYSGKWECGVPMISSRNNPGTAILNGKIYAIGGFHNEELDDVEVFDPVFHIWSPISCMPTKRRRVGVGVLNNKIYVVGGYITVSSYNSNKKRSVSVNTVECYDLNANYESWKRLPKMACCRGCAGVCVLNGLLYVIGGHDKQRSYDIGSVEAYNPANSTWKPVAPMIHCRKNPGVAAYNGKLYVVGGSNNGTPLSSVEIYTPETNTWELLPELMSDKYSSPIVAVINRLPRRGHPSQ